MRYGCETSCGRWEPLLALQPGSSVWPRQSCPAFTPRKEHLSIEGSQCWFCRYADFHLKRPVALEVGICYWPDIQIR